MNTNQKTKICSKCNIEKPLTEFYKNKCGKYGVDSNCKNCKKELRSKYRRENAEKIKERKAKQKENAKKIKERSAKYRKKNAEKIKERKAKYRKKNAEKIKEYGIKYRKENAEKIKERRAKYNSKFRKDLNDSYVKKQIKKSFGINYQTMDNNPELIETYRMKLRVNRLIKNKKDRRKHFELIIKQYEKTKN